MRAVDKAYAAVRDGIIAGRFAPQTRLTEQEVATTAGVSRTPAREALRRLHAEGLVEFTPNRGAVVTPWSADDAGEIFDLRALLESHGAARAALLATQEEIAELARLAEQQHDEAQERGDGHLERIAALNSRFHHCLQQAAASPCLSRTLASLLAAPFALKAFRNLSAVDLQRSAAHHLELVRALAARDPEWAGAVMRAHLLAAKRSLRR